MNILLFVVTCALLTGAKASCVRPPVEESCNRQSGISGDEVIYLTPNPLRQNVTDCIFRTMGYKKNYREFNYEAIKTNPNSLLLLARICDDYIFYDDLNYYNKLLAKAVDSCKRKSYSIAEDLRKCIEDEVRSSDTLKEEFLRRQKQ